MSELVEEGRDDLRTDGHGEEHAINAAPEVGAVVDVVAAAFAHIYRVPHEDGYEEDRRNGNEGEEVDRFPGVEEDEGELDGDHGAGGAEAPIIIVIFMLEIGGNIGGDEGGNV